MRGAVYGVRGVGCRALCVRCPVSGARCWVLGAGCWVWVPRAGRDRFVAPCGSGAAPGPGPPPPWRPGSRAARAGKGWASEGGLRPAPRRPGPGSCPAPPGGRVPSPGFRPELGPLPLPPPSGPGLLPGGGQQRAACRLLPARRHPRPGCHQGPGLGLTPGPGFAPVASRLQPSGAPVRVPPAAQGWGRAECRVPASRAGPVSRAAVRGPARVRSPARGRACGVSLCRRSRSHPRVRPAARRQPRAVPGPGCRGQWGRE